MNACLNIIYCSLQLLGRRRLIEIKNAGYNTKLSAPLDNVPFSTRTERDRIEDSVRKITCIAENCTILLFSSVISWYHMILGSILYDVDFQPTFVIFAPNKLSTGVQK